jgi:hypothetical protein
MDLDGPDRLSDPECYGLLEKLFPHGFAGEDVLREIAPEGWEASPYARVARRPVGEPGRRDPRAELCELVAECLWDIFSDNHDVIAPDGRVADLGSWRASAGFLAELVNHELKSRRYDYMDFYMGTHRMGAEADEVGFSAVYVLVFRRLRAMGFRWRYQFPRLYAIDVRPLRDALVPEAEKGPEWADYSPSKAFEEEERDRNLAELRASLDAGHQEAIEKARHRPPPATVTAYREVYGQFPEGWPPDPSM